MTCTWTDGGVEVNGKKFTVKQINGEWDAFEKDFHGVQEVVRILSSAVHCFEGGIASYRMASENLAHLLDEREKAQTALAEVGMKVGDFFDPPGITQEFVSHQEFAAFLKETGERMKQAKHGG